MKVMECGVRWAVEARRKGASKSNGGRENKDRTQYRSKASKCVSVKKNNERNREQRAQTSRR